MFGQASNLWLSPTSLMPMVAFFFIVHLSSGLSNVSDMPDDREVDDWMKCLEEAKNGTKYADCFKKAEEGEYKEVTNKECMYSFATIKCDIIGYCRDCTKLSFDKFHQAMQIALDTHDKELCKEWSKLTPKLPSSCAESNGTRRDNSPDSGPMSTTSIVIIVVVSVIVVGIVGVIFWRICCSSNGGRAAGKSIKTSKSTKSKRAKSLKAKSKKSKSRKSSKSLKAKSTKSKGGKSMKGK